MLSLLYEMGKTINLDLDWCWIEVVNSCVILKRPWYIVGLSGSLEFVGI